MSDLESVRERLIKGECDVVAKVNNEGDNVLLHALRCKNYPLDVLKLMIDKGADVNSVDRSGNSCLHVALEGQYLTSPINEDVFRELLERGAEVNKLNSSEATPLLKLLKRYDCPVAIVKLLLQHGAEVNCMDVYKDTALRTAIREVRDESVIRVLVEVGANVGKDGNHPLLALLKRKNCSSDLVKLFVDCGANVNRCVEAGGYSPLMWAIRLQSEDVIKVLIEAGADVTDEDVSPLKGLLGKKDCTLGGVKFLFQAMLDQGYDVDMPDRIGNSSLCLAFKHSSNDIVKYLFDAGCSPTVCEYHISALHCAIDLEDNTKWGFREDILDRLLKDKSDLNRVDYKQSLLCFALNKGAKASDIELLIKKGASLTACRLHSVPLICATHGLGDHILLQTVDRNNAFVYSDQMLLQADMVQFLLDKGASIAGHEWQVLEGALGRCDYEVGAIQLLLAIPGVVDCLVAHRSQGSLLHLAVMNESCKPSIIKFLQKKGFPMNDKNIRGDTPLVDTVRNGYDSNVMKELLIAGARIEENCCDGVTLLNYTLQKYKDGEHQSLQWFKILVRFFFLQNPHFDIKDLRRVSGINDMKGYQIHRQWKEIEKFANQCLSELQKMESLHVGDGIKLCDFVRGYCLPNTFSHNCNLEEKNHNLDELLRSTTQNLVPNISSNVHLTNKPSSSSMKSYNLSGTELLKHLAQNEFIMYFDVILARFDRSVLEATLPDLKVFTRRDDLSSKKINLNTDQVDKIASLLSDKDLLAFILAFHHPDNIVQS